MKYRRLGRTGIDVSELVFGCGNVGGLMIRGTQDDMRTTFRRVLDAGINWFDTAAAYGDGVSEQSLGALLREVDDKPYVSTKLRLDIDRLADAAGEIERLMTESLERLGRPSVDLVQLHNPIAGETGERNAIAETELTKSRGVIDALDRIRDQGMTRFIGMTGLGEGESCRRIAETGRFDTAQVYYNMLNPSAARAMPPRWTGQNFAGLLDACRSRDMGVIAIRIMAAGILASDVRHGRESMLTSDTDVASEERKAHAVFDALGDGHGTRAQASIRFVLSNAVISAANIGVAEPAQFDESLGAVELGPLPGEALARLDGLYDTDFESAG
jgi:aryl-alcohol dehydrogenase-like predicted oxidoreductase